MNFNNIFMKKSSDKNLDTSFITESITGDFDCELALLENLKMVEDEYNDIVVEHTRTTYTGMKLHNCEILEEGFKDMLNNAVEFFKNLIKRIIEFFKKSFSYLTSFIGDFEKFIKKNSDLLNKLDPDFDIKGYKYTIDSSMPKVDKIDYIISTYNDELKNLPKKKYSELTVEKNEFMSASYLNKMRAYTINTGGEIAEGDYLKEIKKSLRGGLEEPETIHVDKSLLKDTITKYSEIKSRLNETQKDYNKVVGVLNDMKNFFNTNPNVYYSGGNKVIGTKSITKSDSKLNYGDKVEYEYTGEDQLKMINLFFNFKYTQSKTFSVMITNAYFEKINAMKEALKQYEKIVRGSIIGKSNKDSDDKDGDK